MMQKHFAILQAIIGNYFMNDMPNNTYLYKKINGTSITYYSLNCIGFFSWNSNLEDEYTKFILFPTFFDYLDSYVDLRFDCINKHFKEKIDIIYSKIDKNSIDDLFLHTLYKICSPIRNKMLHHQLNYEDTKVTAKDITITISQFRVINELIYQYVKFSTIGKSLFEKNALYSGLVDILKKNNDSDHKFIQQVESMPDYLFIKPYKFRRHLRICSPIDPTDLIIDRVYSSAGYFYDEIESFKEKYPDPEEKIVGGNDYYFFQMEDKFYLMPSELVRKCKNITFGKIGDWEFQTQ